MVIKSRAVCALPPAARFRFARCGLALLIALACLLAGQLSVSASDSAKAARAATAAGSDRAAARSTTSWVFKTLHNPDRVRVLDDSTRTLATFTVGARTVTLRGAARTFAEPTTTTAGVVTRIWVRLLPRPFTGEVDGTWLKSALADTGPDVLAVSAQYVTGAPTVQAADGSVVSSDADYGPPLADGTREEGSDFNDYLGVAWAYGTRTDSPEQRQITSLDCSGFVRMVFGYRSGLPMSLSPDGNALPRRSFEMLESGPGVVTLRNSGTRPSSDAAVSPGDLLFFDGSPDDGARIDHVGIYLGIDSVGARRFISSRETVNGPTLGDAGGKSTLSGTGYYANAWRAARRL